MTDGPRESSSPCLLSDTPPVKDEINPHHLISEGREPRSSGKEGLHSAGSEECTMTLVPRLLPVSPTLF